MSIEDALARAERLEAEMRQAAADLEKFSARLDAWETAATAARADMEDALVRAGDPAGVYGMYPPADLSGSGVVGFRPSVEPK